MPSTQRSNQPAPCPPGSVRNRTLEKPTKGFLGFRYFEPEGAWASLVPNNTFGIEYVNPIGKTRISEFNGVVNLVDHGWQRDLQTCCTQFGKLFAFFIRPRLIHADVRCFVVRCYPAIEGMSFFDVDKKEIDPFLEILIPVFDVTDTVSEGASSVTAENKDRRLTAQRGYLDRSLTVHAVQHKLGSQLSYLRSTYDL